MSDRDHLSTLSRGLKLLAVLNRSEGMNISELARAIGLPRTNANRIIATLMAEGYVERIPFEFGYRLTPRVCELSSGFSDEGWITHIASPLLFERTKEIGWPLALATPAGESMVVRVTTDYASPYALEHFRVGHRVPMIHGPAGQVYLAYAPEAERQSILKLIRRSSDPRQAIASDESYVDYLLEKTRSRGFAHLVSPEYNEAGIAVPLVIGGVVRAALFMGYIKRALRPEAATARFVPALQGYATQIANEVEAARSQAEIRSKTESEEFAKAAAPARSRLRQ